MRKKTNDFDHKLASAASEVRRATKKHRNDTLNEQAFMLGLLVPKGLDRNRAEEALMRAAISAGLPERETKSTIKSGLNKGEKKAPLQKDSRSAVRAPSPPVQPKSPNPRVEFIGTRWPNKTSPGKGEAFRMTLAEMVRQVKEPAQARGRKEDQPQWTLASFEGNYRSGDRFTEAHGLMLDFDDGNVTREAIQKAFAQWAFVAHTSWSHTKEAPRWRVMLPLTRAVKEDEYRLLWGWAGKQLGGLDEGDAGTPAKAYYLPVQRPVYEHAAHLGEPLDVERVLGGAEGEVSGEDGPDLESMRLGSFMKEASATVMRRWTGEEKPIPMPWGKVTELLGGGWWPGLTVLVGGTGTGKSQFALQASLHAASQGHPVMYVGLELDHLGIYSRLLGLRSGEYWSNFYLGKSGCHSRKGAATLDIAQVMDDHWKVLEDLPFYFEPGSCLGWSSLEMERLCKKVRARYPEDEDGEGRRIPGSKPFLLVLDFLQLIGGQDDAEQLRERIGRAAYMARAVARDYGASVVLVSSTARENYKKVTDEVDPGSGNPGKLVGLGKESGEIEYAADWVLVLVADEKSRSLDNPTYPVHIAAAKVRAGRPGWAKLMFDGLEFTENQGLRKLNIGGRE